MATEHLKCGNCDKGTEFLILVSVCWLPKVTVQMYRIHPEKIPRLHEAGKAIFSLSCVQFKNFDSLSA